MQHVGDYPQHPIVHLFKTEGKREFRAELVEGGELLPEVLVFSVVPQVYLDSGLALVIYRCGLGLDIKYSTVLRHCFEFISLGRSLASQPAESSLSYEID